MNKQNKSTKPNKYILRSCSEDSSKIICTIDNNRNKNSYRSSLDTLSPRSISDSLSSSSSSISRDKHVKMKRHTILQNSTSSTGSFIPIPAPYVNRPKNKYKTNDNPRKINNFINLKPNVSSSSNSSDSTNSTNSFKSAKSSLSSSNKSSSIMIGSIFDEMPMKILLKLISDIYEKQ